MWFHLTMQGVCLSVTFFHRLPPFVCHSMLLSRGFPAYLFTGIFVFFLSTFTPTHRVVSQLYLDASTGKRYSFPPSISSKLSVTTEQKQFIAAEASKIQHCFFRSWFLERQNMFNMTAIRTAFSFWKRTPAEFLTSITEGTSSISQPRTLLSGGSRPPLILC